MGEFAILRLWACVVYDLVLHSILQKENERKRGKGIFTIQNRALWINSFLCLSTGCVCNGCVALYVKEVSGSAIRLLGK